ncbi:FadR/GntR family transcriptional regulator [Herbiconiux daphne]|uniref:FadR family transcriptional regulator n=1 Tax=Herbiconiux daphne TaxID=2970914 RepID=A0ABT2H3M2_9MICO|nr:FadR/GntR family transcriptional regulator [Herbiconiux daphne]MCS5734530.1 FadR family transcriptional regulator [Herbiconiux daphne]
MTEPAINARWKQVRNARASEDVVNQIKEAFFDGMSSGDWVGTEADLATRFGVSRITIRDAIRTLEVQGVVEVKVGSGGGLRIAEADPDRFADALSVQLHLLGITWQEVVEAMQTVEPLTARLAAQRADPDDLERLRAALAAAGDRVDDPHSFTERSLDFHLLVAEASHNRALRASVRALRSVQSLKFEPNTSEARARDVSESHQKIFDAIAAGDPDQAAAAMSEHLEHMSVDPSQHH